MAILYCRTNESILAISTVTLLLHPVSRSQPTPQAKNLYSIASVAILDCFSRVTSDLWVAVVHQHRVTLVLESCAVFEWGNCRIWEACSDRVYQVWLVASYSVVHLVVELARMPDSAPALYSRTALSLCLKCRTAFLPNSKVFAYCFWLSRVWTFL